MWELYSITSVEDPKEARTLIDRYQKQLDYYERALAQMTGKPVKEKIIYSLGLNREIRL